MYPFIIRFGTMRKGVLDEFIEINGAELNIHDDFIVSVNILDIEVFMSFEIYLLNLNL